MTLAAAFRCSDGIIVCADTQHTGSRSKFQKKKIHDFLHDGALLVVAGAGTKSYINMCVDLLHDGFKAGAKTFPLIDKLIKDTIRTVYQDHIGVQVRAQRLPNGEVPQVFLIVSAKLPDGSVEAWKVDEMAVSRCGHVAFVGIGEDIAEALAEWLYPEPATERMATVQILAKEIVTETKRIAPSVGGKTHLCTIPKGTSGGSMWNLRKTHEHGFFWGINHMLGEAIHAAIAKQYSDEAFELNLGRLVEHLNTIRKKAQSLPDGREYELMLDPLD
jgi:hypothetical protein